jgi:hypothetical protein
MLFEQTSRPGADGCTMAAENTQNSRMFEWVVFPGVDAQCRDKAAVVAFAAENKRLVRGGYGPLACNIEQELHIGEATLDPSKNQLCARVFGAPPDMRRGAGEPEIEDRVKQGSATNVHRSCNVLSEVTIDRFEPLIPCIERNIQNPSHIVPKWIRGGEPTRDVDHQKRFLSHIGYEYDGRAWYKRPCAATPSTPKK